MPRPEHGCEYWLVEKARAMCRYITDDDFIARYVGGITPYRVSQLRKYLPKGEHVHTLGAMAEHTAPFVRRESSQDVFDRLDKLSRQRALTDEESLQLEAAILKLNQLDRHRCNQAQRDRRERRRIGEART